MTEKNMICITCPMGCEMTVCLNDKGELCISGNQCQRGISYAQEEYENPVRVLTTTLPVKFGHLPVVSVKTNKKVPKSRMIEFIAALGNVELTAPLRIGEVAVNGILGTDIDLILTKDVHRIQS